MARPTAIRVLVVDRHEMVRRGLATFLGACDGLELVGEAASGEEAVERCADLQPDVVLLEVGLPGMDGVAATRAIRRRCLRARVIGLTSADEADLAERVLRAGAASCLLKYVSGDELARAIRAALHAAG